MGAETHGWMRKDGLNDAKPPYRGLRFGRLPSGEPANGSR
jgi:hypothetical protein